MTSSAIAKLRDWPDDTVALTLVWSAHLILGIAMSHSGPIANLHAFVTLFIALIVGLTARQPVSVAYMAAYLVGSEVLWRITHASVFYETGKYGIAACFLLALMRVKKVKISMGAWIYFGLLIPAIFVTIASTHASLRLMRMTLSFHMSGPLALMTSMWFFANVKLTRAEIWRVTLYLVTPILAVVALTVFATQTAADLEFTTESNFITSGGFGPNQVSAVLGLAATLLLLYQAQERMHLLRRAIFMAALCACIIQSALTFSRGGIYAATGTFVVSIIFLAADPWARARVVVLVAIVGALAVLFVIPYLMILTKGKIGDRFGDSGLTNRGSIMMQDVEVWKKKPFYGAGVGLSMAYHAGGAAPHNEFTRLIADHGTLGFLALLTLIGQGLHSFLKAKGVQDRAFTTAMMMWPLLFLSANGFRIAAPAFIFGLGYMTRRREEPRPPMKVAPSPPIAAFHPQLSA